MARYTLSQLHLGVDGENKNDLSFSFHHQQSNAVEWGYYRAPTFHTRDDSKIQALDFASAIVKLSEELSLKARQQA